MKLNEQEPQRAPEELLVGRFSRCSNYPKDREGQIFLTQGLVKASKATGVEASAIVDRCAELSEYCPTDYDLMIVAREIKTQRRTQEEPKREREKMAGWERECGNPEVFDLVAEANKIRQNGIDGQAKRKRMLDLIHEACKTQGKDWTKISQQAWMRLQIWAQEQVGIPVTPEQRREIGE